MEDAMKAQQAKLDADLQGQLDAAQDAMARNFREQMAAKNASMAEEQRKAQEAVEAEQRRLAEREAAALRAQAEANKTQAALDSAKADFDKQQKVLADKLEGEEDGMRRRMRQQALMSCQCKAFGH